MNIVYNYVSYTAQNKRIPLQEDIDLLELDHEVHISLGRELSFRSESMFSFQGRTATAPRWALGLPAWSSASSPSSASRWSTTRAGASACWPAAARKPSYLRRPRDASEVMWMRIRRAARTRALSPRTALTRTWRKANQEFRERT